MSEVVTKNDLLKILDKLPSMVLSDAGIITDLYDYISDYGVKNMVPLPYYRQSGYIENGVTYTYDEDGVITANGTSTGTSYFQIWRYTQGKFPVEAGKKYILSIEVDGGEASVYFAHYDENLTNLGEFAVRNISNAYSEVTFTAWTDEYASNGLGVYVRGDTTFNNTKIKVMIRPAEIRNTEYQSYSMSNTDLTKFINISDTTKQTYRNLGCDI